MSTIRERVDALKKLAEDLEVVAVLEEENLRAKETFRSDPSEKNKVAKRRAAEALALAREATRNSPVRDVEPGGMTITPATVG